MASDYSNDIGCGLILLAIVVGWLFFHGEPTPISGVVSQPIERCSWSDIHKLNDGQVHTIEDCASTVVAVEKFWVSESSQTVGVQLNSGSAPFDFEKCHVVNTKNWLCVLEDGSSWIGKVKYMEDGKFVASDWEVRPISWWKYWPKRFGQFVDSLRRKR